MQKTKYQVLRSKCKGLVAYCRANYQHSRPTKWPTVIVLDNFRHVIFNSFVHKHAVITIRVVWKSLWVLNLLEQ